MENFSVYGDIQNEDQRFIGSYDVTSNRKGGDYDEFSTETVVNQRNYVDANSSA